MALTHCNDAVVHSPRSRRPVIDCFGGSRGAAFAAAGRTDAGVPPGAAPAGRPAASDGAARHRTGGPRHRGPARFAKNPMLARRPGSVCPACGCHRRSGRCSGCRTASPANEAEPSHAPLESVEALARRGARRGARRRGGRRLTRRDLPFWSRPAASSVFKADVIGVELPLRPRSFRAPPGPVLADKDYFSRTNRA